MSFILLHDLNLISVKIYPTKDNQMIYRKRKESPLYFPTFYPQLVDTPLPDDLYDSTVHPFDQPSITFAESK